ncbi:MAG: SEC-C domain-containing protein [Candidatus Binatia bacterium]|jgi:hypothetical protein
MEQREWVGGRLVAPMYITEGEPYRPDIILWLESGTDVIVGSTVVHPSEPISAVADCLTQALDKPMMGPRRRPDRIRVADPALVEGLREVVGTGVRIDTAPTPELDAIVRLMAETLPEGRGEAASYFEGGRVSPDTVAAFFQAAARLYRVAPWQVLWDSHLLSVDVREFATKGACVSVIGALGESFGVLIYDSVESHRAMEAMAAVLEETGDLPEDLGTGILSLNFDRRSDIPKAMRREIARHGWEVAGPNAYPRVMLIDADRLLRPLTERDVRRVSVIAEGLAAFCARHRNQLAAGLSQPITEEFAVRFGVDTFTMRVTAPHPDCQWDDGEDDDDEGEARESEATQLLEAFLEAQDQAQHPTATLEQGRIDWIDAAGFICDALLRYKLDYADGRLDRFTAADIEDFLLDHFPRKVTADEQMVRRTPEILLAFCAWLRESGRVTPRAAQAMARCIREKQTLFYRYAADRSRFGLAKGFVALAQERGVDIADEAQMQGFVAEYNDMLQKGLVDPVGPLFPSRFPAEPPETSLRTARPAKHRWAPQPGERAPDPASPCPCGSGRRYKKCCMQR